jgi:hypothetical protein
MSSCHNCGAHQGGSENPGRNIQITLQAENTFKRARKVSVWVCTDECAYQALGQSKYGISTHKWPIDLAKFRGVTKLEKVTV